MASAPTVLFCTRTVCIQPRQSESLRVIQRSAQTQSSSSEPPHYGIQRAAVQLSEADLARKSGQVDNSATKVSFQG